MNRPRPGTALTFGQDQDRTAWMTVLGPISLDDPNLPRPAQSWMPSSMTEKTASPSGRFGESMSLAMRLGPLLLRR